MIYHENGDLLESDCTTILHQANCFKTMGAGIAKSIAKKYPEAKYADKNLKLSSKERYGRFSYANSDNGVTIVNLYGQYNLGKTIKSNYQERYEKLESAIDEFLTKSNNNEIKVNLSKVGIPYKMGCAIAGGDWFEVENIIKRQSEKHEVDIFIYKL